jgi:opacity protein-like surface antigen
VEPYLLLGAGIYFNKTTLEDTVGVLQDQSSASAGVHFGGGVNFHLSRTAFVGLETRYLWATAEDENGLDYDIDGFRTMMTLGIKF